MTKIKEIISNMLKVKSADVFLETAEKSELKKTLGIFDLITLGIGAVVGTGIFTVVGIAAVGSNPTSGAGPALIISMLIVAVSCVFSALCYSEFASMMPVAGSVYTYTYATMGEFMAWIVGWILMLEYAIGNITVASAWTGYLFQFLKGFEHILPHWLVNPPIWLINDYKTISNMCLRDGLDIHTQIPYLFDKIPFAINLPAIFIIFLLTALLVKGVRESTRLASIMVGLNLFVITSFILVGAFYVKPENWTPFAPNGMGGIFMGAFLIFFAYIGFDAISTAAEETKNPQRDLPIGILGTLVICTVLYVCVALVLTGMMKYNTIDFQAPIAYAMRFVGQNKIAGMISAGALAGLTSVLLVYQLGTTRILYAMSRDGFLPKILQTVHKKHKTPHIITWVSGIIVAFGALFLDINMSAELCNYGAFTSFIIVCVAVIILRHTDPNRKRPFKVPFSPWFPLLGIVSCGGLMVYYTYKSLENAVKDNALLSSTPVLFLYWFVIGVIFYFMYCYGNQRKNNN